MIEVVTRTLQNVFQFDRNEHETLLNVCKYIFSTLLDIGHSLEKIPSGLHVLIFAFPVSYFLRFPHWNYILFLFLANLDWPELPPVLGFKDFSRTSCCLRSLCDEVDQVLYWLWHEDYLSVCGAISSRFRLSLWWQASRWCQYLVVVFCVCNLEGSRWTLLHSFHAALVINPFSVAHSTLHHQLDKSINPTVILNNIVHE